VGYVPTIFCGDISYHIIFVPKKWAKHIWQVPPINVPEMAIDVGL